MKLYHYTCADSAPRIERCGYLLPHRQVALDDIEMIWLTDMNPPDRAALGLTSETLACDRTDFRVEVDFDAVHWPFFARRLPRITQDLRYQLEREPGVLPMHWWVALDKVPIVSIERTYEASHA